MRPESMKSGIFCRRELFHAGCFFFRLAEGLRLSTMSSHKNPGFSGRNDVRQDGGFKGRHPTMPLFDGELSRSFEVVEPAAWRAPIIFNSPHSGSAYPDEFL